MKLMKRNKFLHITLLSLTALSSLLPINAFAEETVELTREDYFYLGARGGMTTYDDLCVDKNNCQDDDIGYTIYAGYQFNDWFALEAHVGDYGSADFDRPLTVGGYERTQDNIYGAELAAKLTAFELGDDFNIYARLGVAYQQMTSTSAINGELDYDRFGGLSAIGMEYHLTNRWAIRAEYEYLHFVGDSAKPFEDANMQFASLGLTYKFRKNKALPVVAPVIEEKPAPEIIMVNDYNQVDAIFDFDSSDINDVPRLNEMSQKLLSESEGEVLIKAYTDSIGTEEYNQALSERRALSAKEFLLDKGIEEERIATQGMGESDPIATNDTKEGRAANRRLEFEYQISTIKE